MKKSYIYVVAIISVIITGLFVTSMVNVDKYVEAKNQELEHSMYKSAFNNIAKVFDGKNRYWVDSNISNNYFEVNKSEHHKNTNVGRYLDEEDQGEGFNSDIYKVFHPQSLKNKIWHTYIDEQKYHGWVMSVATLRDRVDFEGGTQSEYGGVIIYKIRPYEVCYRKQKDSYFYDIMNVEDALNTAMNFYVKNKQSDFKKYGKLLKDDNWLDFYDSVRGRKLNEGFYISSMNSDSAAYSPLANLYFHLKDIKKTFIDRNPFGYYSYMYNGFYRVYIEGSVFGEFLPILKNYEYFESLKEKSLIKCYSLLTIGYAVLIFIIGLISVFLYSKREKTLFEILKEQCNPKRYLDPYDKEKVDVATDLYRRVISCDKNNNNELIAIRNEAVSKLNINWVDSKRIKRLKRLVNPKKYTSDKMLDKLPIANELYNKLSSGNMSPEEIDSLENEIIEKLK